MLLDMSKDGMYLSCSVCNLSLEVFQQPNGAGSGVLRGEVILKGAVRRGGCGQGHSSHTQTLRWVSDKDSMVSISGANDVSFILPWEGHYD
jgi:hypothetical protein